MKLSSFESVRRAALLALVVASTVSAACTSGSLVSGPEAPALLGRSVRLAYRMHQPAPDGYLDIIPADERAREEATGTQFFADKLVSGRIPATGHYLRIGDRMIQGGLDGVFQIPSDIAVPATAPLFAQLSDTQPLAQVSLSGALRPATETPLTVDVRIDCKPFPDSVGMDFGSDRSRATKPKDCCTRQTSRQILDCERRVYTAADLALNNPSFSACDDFDNKTLGRVGAKEKCVAQRFFEFFGTPCYQWTFGSEGKSAACINERAILDIDGNGCFENHKYRFCQNMGPTDFNALPQGSTTVAVGGSVVIKVRNNTPSVETQVEQSKQTDGAFVSGVKSGQIKHYDDPSKTHLTEVACEWLAPSSLPDNTAEVTETLTFRAGGLTKVVTIKVVQNCTDTRGRQVPCK